MKIDNIDNIANKEKSPDKAERTNSIDDIKKTEKFFDFNDLSNSAATVNENVILPEKSPAVFECLSPGSSKLKKLLLNNDPEVANLNINNEKVHSNEYHNIINNDSSALPMDTIFNNEAIPKINNNINLYKSKLEKNSINTILNSNKNGEKKSARNFSKQKLFWCSECNEYFIRQNLFIHMKSVHDKFTCLYCYGFFVKIESLENHLLKKHKVQNTSFYDEHTLRNYFDLKETETVSKVIKAVCCKCSTTFVITDNNFHSHCCDHTDENTSTPLKEAIQTADVFRSDFSGSVVSENTSFIDNITHSSINQLNTVKNVESCIKGQMQWTQNLNGAITNEESSQSVPHEIQNININNIRNEDPSWHIEEQTCTSENDKMIVPKLTLKIPKGFQKQPFDNINSDEDSGDEDEDSNNESASDNSDENNKSNKNLSNSINEYSSSFSDSNNEDSQTQKENELETLETKQLKRPENMPCLKLKIKNLTSNPESVLENFDYTTHVTPDTKPKSDDFIDREEPRDEVDLSEMPMDIEPSIDTKNNTNNQYNEDSESEKFEPKKIIIDGNIIVPANSDDILPIHIRLDESLDKIPILKLMKICLQASFQLCLYCNHARKIVVNGKGLALHFITHHRFHALVESITGEELFPEKFVFKFEGSIEELSKCFFNLDTYDDHDVDKREGHVTISHEKLYECFQCRFQTPIHKELYLHNRKMHQKSLINCLMCKMGFYSYSELLCHICPGMPNKQTFNDYKFYCCLCNMDNIPSAFRLMVHLRKKHYACDVCLEKCSDQSKLSSHVWKHKLLHICYRCHIFYQNKADIMKHLFWKHGTEGIECKKCLQKKWPHVYHFCIPPATFTCPHCDMQFSRAITLKVHIRLHEDGAKYACTEIGCEKMFISKKLLIRHLERHQSELISQENGDQAKTEGSVIIPQEIPDGFCTRTIPVTFKRFIKKPAIRKIEATEPSPVETMDKVESESTKNKEDENKDKKTILDLPEAGNLNLSESSDQSSNESSDEDDKTENKNHNQSKILVPTQNNDTDDKSNICNVDEILKQGEDSLKQKQFSSDPNTLLVANKISTLSDSDDEEDDSQSKVKEESMKTKNVETICDANESMQNILENLKNFKEIEEKKHKVIENGKEETTTDILEAIKDDEFQDKLPDKIQLHVCMSDHDYAQLYNPGVGGADDLDSVIQSAKIDKKDKKSEKSSNKAEKSIKNNDDFSSSDSSSGSSSDSSNSDSSSSSSSSTSDSSSSEASSTNTNRLRNKKYTKKRSKKEKKNQTETEEQEPTRDPDDIIYESDLFTDETDTDEDFYDEHPLKINNDGLSEKRKQLGDIDEIVENSRPSTPSLPPDEKIEKRMKVKKRKRDHKKSVSSPTKRLQQRDQSSFNNNHDDDSKNFSTNSHLERSLINLPNTPQNLKSNRHGFIHTSTPISAPPRIELHQANQIRQLLQSTQQQPVLPILKEQHNSQFQQKYDQSNNEYINVSRVSSAQSSRMNSDNEQSGIKRSQRRRIPNKFYGYTSDDNNSLASQPIINDPFKPIPPPNLTWNKEDLPSRSKSPNPSHQQQKIASMKMNLNNDHMHHSPQVFDTFESSSVAHQIQQQKLPSNDFYNINNNNDINSGNKSNEIRGHTYSDSESSGDELHISETNKRKRKLPSQSMYAFHTLETPPTTVQTNLPPIPRLKLTIGSNNKIRRRNINPLKPPTKKRRKIPPKSASTSFKDVSLNSFNSVSTAASKPFTKQHSRKSSIDQSETSMFSNNKMMADEKKQKLEEAIMNTQQYFQRYNHTQLTNSETSQDQVDNNDGRVYCYCRRPYDDLQGMIGCDGPSCQIEWFHFECVGILVPPKGNWFCPQCQNQQH